MKRNNTFYVKIGFKNRTNKSMYNEHNKKKYQQTTNKDRDLIIEEKKIHR